MALSNKVISLNHIILFRFNDKRIEVKIKKGSLVLIWRIYMLGLNNRSKTQFQESFNGIIYTHPQPPNLSPISQWFTNEFREKREIEEFRECAFSITKETPKFIRYIWEWRRPTHFMLLLIWALFAIGSLKEKVGDSNSWLARKFKCLRREFY